MGELLPPSRFLKAGILLGVLTFAVHLLLFPPGWLWFSVIWAVLFLSGAMGFSAGVLGIGPLHGLPGASAPGFALALRGEVFFYYHGCFESVQGETCSYSSGRQSGIIPSQIVWALCLVFVVTIVGYGLGVVVYLAGAYEN